jgi:hypothetical protein
MEEEIHTWQEDKEVWLDCRRKWKDGEGQKKQESQRTKNAYEYVQEKRYVGARLGPLPLCSTIWTPAGHQVSWECV